MPAALALGDIADGTAFCYPSREIFSAFHASFGLAHVRTRCASLLLLCCAGGCAAFSQPVDDNVIRCREQCQAALDAQRRAQFDRADQLLASAVDACPEDERARRLYAEALWQRGDAASAITHMDEAVRLSGGDAQLSVRLGEMYLARGDSARAARHAAAAITAAPQLPAAWALEGDVLASQRNREAALARYHRALAYRRDYPQVQFAVAEIYAQQGRHQRALATLAALSEQFEPDRMPQRLAVMRGVSHKALGQYDAAADQFTLAAKAAPPTPELLYELADSLLLAGEPSAARLAAEQALSLAPDHMDSRRLMAQLVRQQQAASPEQY
jgi:tetratricopeptide (TPR) repeat protein